jgi:release factor glutamine methyltransferase
MLTLRQALHDLAPRLPEADTAWLEARWLLSHVLGIDSAALFARQDELLTPAQATALATLAARRAAGEPLAYVLGTAGFYGREFIVSPAVLIPRPETEHLLEAALAHAAPRPALTAADIGTGSGILAITLALHVPAATVHAVDVSAAALAVARQNAARHGAERIVFHEGDLVAPLAAAGVRVGLLLANLPYIASAEVPTLAVSRHEPHLALDGGDDGLRLIAALLRAAPAVCTADALLLLEIGAGQGPALQRLVAALLPGAACHLQPDYAGHDRVAHIRLPGPPAGG